MKKIMTTLLVIVILVASTISANAQAVYTEQGEPVTASYTVEETQIIMNELLPPSYWVKDGSLDESLIHPYSTNCYGFAIGVYGVQAGGIFPGFMSGATGWDRTGSMQVQIKSDLETLGLEYQFVEDWQNFNPETDVPNGWYAVKFLRTQGCPSDYDERNAFIYKMVHLAEVEDFHFTVYVPGYGWLQKNGWILPPNNYLLDSGAIDITRYDVGIAEQLAKNPYIPEGVVLIKENKEKSLTEPPQERITVMTEEQLKEMISE